MVGGNNRNERRLEEGSKEKGRGGMEGEWGEQLWKNEGRGGMESKDRKK